MTREDVLGELLDDDLAQELTTSSPPPKRCLKFTIQLTPLRVKLNPLKDEECFSLQPLQSPDKPTPTALDTQDSTRWATYIDTRSDFGCRANKKKNRQ